MALKWASTAAVTKASYECGHCGHKVGPSVGYVGNLEHSSRTAHIYICPTCTYPTFSFESRQIPSPVFGNQVEGITDEDIANLYKQARDCSSLGAHTATAMLCRKILMNIAVSKGAAPGLTFAAYVNFLSDNHHVPVDSKDWVDEIRTKGNEANHEIHLTTPEDSQEILTFVEMLLKLTFEFRKRKSMTPKNPSNP